jgi:ADP-heptose:LPS heptosyltransferase
LNLESDFSSFIVTDGMEIAHTPGMSQASAPHQHLATTPGPFPRPVRSLVAVELTHLGDLIAALPAIRQLSKNLRPDVFHVAVDRGCAGLLSALEADVSPVACSATSSVFGFFSAVASVRRLHPDLVLSLSPTRRNAYLTLLSGAPFRAGFLKPGGSAAHYTHRSSVDSRGFDLQPVDYPPGENIERRALTVCRALGLEETTDLGPWRLREEVLGETERRLRSEGFLPSGPYIILHPTARWDRRRWPADRFVRLIRSIVEHAPHRILLVSSQAESALVKPIVSASAWTSRVRGVFPVSLVDTAVLIARADLFVGNDSGPLHLAAALGTTCIGLYGPAEPHLTAPRTSDVTPLYRKVPCSPCDQKGCPHPSALCMEAIGVEDVARAVLTALGLPSSHMDPLYG